VLVQRESVPAKRRMSATVRPPPTVTVLMADADADLLKFNGF